MRRFERKVAVVTGGASGIGEATAEEFAAEGARVGIIDIDADGLNRVVRRLQAAGAEAEAFSMDVADPDACQRVSSRIAQCWGVVNCLVNGAASFTARGVDVSSTDWDRSLGVNVRGYANTVQAFLGQMPSGASIVNISSVSAHIAQPSRWTYNASKGAINALSRCQALDLAKSGIRVNIVSPGWIWTREVERAAGSDRERNAELWAKFHMLRRLGEPREVARAVLFLCSDDASFITGAELMVDGGYLAMGPEGLGESSAFAGSK